MGKRMAGKMAGSGHMPRLAAFVSIRFGRLRIVVRKKPILPDGQNGTGAPMPETQTDIDIDELVSHDDGEDCVVCLSSDISASVVVPAVLTWEEVHDLPRGALALHSAAGLLAAMIEAGVPRHQVEAGLFALLDEFEQIKAERDLGMVQGNA